MLIREYQESDLAALRAIHAAQGFAYELPDLSNPLFVTKLVLLNRNVAPDLPAACPPTGGQASFTLAGFPSADSELEDAALKSGATTSQTATSPASGEILGAALLRLTAEAYLLLDPRAGTPRERWEWLLALHAATERDAWRRGLEDVQAWLPPSIAAKFGKRLVRLGWIRDDAWTPYCKKLDGRT